MSRRGGLGLALLLTLALAAPALGAARGTGRDGRPTPAEGTPGVGADRPDAKGEATPVPIAVTTAVAPAGLDAAPPLPGGSVPWAAVAAPPAHGAAGAGMLLQGGGGGAPQLRYYALDALGSVRVVFDAAGQVVSRADYEPFGAAVPASTTGPLPRQQYTGHERDGEVGVDYFGARLYVPTLGRLPSVDPLYVGAVEEPQRWNRYAYALNAPTHVRDPDGRTARTCAGKSNGKVDDCKTGGGAADAEPTLTIGHSEHSPDLFLLMQYGDFGYGAGGGGGGGVNMSEWDSVLQKPKSFLVGSVRTVDEDGKEQNVPTVVDSSSALVVAAVGNPAAGAAAVVVYTASAAGRVIYVGITSRPVQRALEHLKGPHNLKIEPMFGLGNLTRLEARGVEQYLIGRWGLQKVGGQLINQINSIAPTKDNFHALVQRGEQLYRWAGGR